MQRRMEKQKSFYYEWLEKEGIPVYEGVSGIEDVTELPRRPWARMGGSGTFIELKSTKAERTILYVAEIPTGGALEPEKHLYEELIYILRGRGLTEVWHEGQGKVSFEWGEGSLFAIPMNAWHRLVNGGREPVLIFAKTNAPSMINAFRDPEFIFNCDYNFTDRFTGQSDYFVATERQNKGESGNSWVTNFVPDVRTAFLDDQFEKVESGQITSFDMAAWGGVHSSEWPVGIYHKAHYHAAGRVLLGLKSVGYVLIWDRQYGIHPYQDGHGDKVVKVAWKPGSIYSPDKEWFHTHFNTGKEPARYLALRNASKSDRGGPEGAGYDVYVSVRDSGTLIEYEDEDPEIRRMFQEELRKNGVEFAMKPVVYRTDPFQWSQ
ncbi:cupin domain-containing protein [Chloroflexota bacterium]